VTRKCVDKPPRKLINTVPAIHFDVDTIDAAYARFGVVGQLWSRFRQKILGNAVRASADCNELITIVR
jgi:hypothetical protein